MKHDRDFWTRHVGQWRTSGLTQAMYCRRHHLTEGTLGYWSSKLRRPQAAATKLVEVGHTGVKDQRAKSPIELVVERRYLLRLWPGMDPVHMRDVLSVLEDRP
jgi:hypothetical protein